MGLLDLVLPPASPGHRVQREKDREVRELTKAAFVGGSVALFLSVLSIFADGEAKRKDVGFAFAVSCIGVVVGGTVKAVSSPTGTKSSVAAIIASAEKMQESVDEIAATSKATCGRLDEATTAAIDVQRSSRLLGGDMQRCGSEIRRFREGVYKMSVGSSSTPARPQRSANVESATAPSPSAATSGSWRGTTTPPATPPSEPANDVDAFINGLPDETPVEAGYRTELKEMQEVDEWETD